MTNTIEFSKTQVPFSVRNPRAYIAKRSVRLWRAKNSWERFAFAERDDDFPLFEDDARTEFPLFEDEARQQYIANRSGCPLLEELVWQHYLATPPVIEGNVKPAPQKGNGAQPDRTEAERFLKLLDPEAASFTFQTFDDSKERKAQRMVRVRHGSLAQHWDELCGLNAQGAGIFVTINVTDGKSRTATSIRRVRAQFNDLDGAPLEPVLQSKTPPHIVVATSPSKYHTYQLCPHNKLELFGPIQKALAEEFGGDPSVSDLSRVMRLPGFFHCKGEPFLVRIHSTRDGPPYIPYHFKGAAGDKKKKGRATVNEKRYDGFRAVSSEPDKVQRALNAFPNTADIERAEWINVLQEVYEGTAGSDVGLAAAIAWTLTWAGFELEKHRHKKATCAEDTTKEWKTLCPHSRTRASLYARADKASGTGWRREEEIESATVADSAEASTKQSKTDWHNTDLFDPWAKYLVPKFPLDVLPPRVQEFVVARSEVIGCSVSAMAMSVLATFSSALSHEFLLKLMRHGDWYASPRLWVLLYGDPSYKKTPIFDAATKPLEAHQARVQEQYRFNLKAAEACGSDKPPEPERYVTYDITPEKMGELLARNPRGLLAKHDELSGLLGHMERYGGKGGQAAKAFWLKAFDGVPYVFDRIGRGSIFIKNLSSSLLAGIQPKKMAELGNLTSDGLLQRFLPYVMTEQRFARDCPCNTQSYDALVQELLFAPSQVLSLSDAALGSMNELREHLHELELITGGLAEGFQSFIGKLHGLAGSLTLILHKIAEPNGGTIVEKATVNDVQRLVDDFILPHARVFYQCAEEATNGDRLRKIASYILTSGKTRLVASDLTVNVADFRGLTVFEVNERLSPLVATDWLKPEKNGVDNRSWHVNPNVHAQLAKRTKEEEARKTKLAKMMHSPRKDTE
jgi:Protein of unknown function (DUF3987)/RepB DNA-primase from phage plasmid